MDITIACSDDWQGLYVDGELVYQGHEVSVRTLFHFLSIDLNVKFSEIDVDFSWLEEEMTLPEKLEDVHIG